MLLRNIFSGALPDWHCLLILQCWSQDSAVHSGGKVYHECPYLIAQILSLTVLPLQGMSCLNRMKNARFCFLKQLLCFLLLRPLLLFLTAPGNLETKITPKGRQRTRPFIHNYAAHSFPYFNQTKNIQITCYK